MINSLHSLFLVIQNQVRFCHVTKVFKSSKMGLRVRAVALEDLQHAGAGDVPHLGAELLPVQDDQVLQAVGSRSGQLLVVCGGWHNERMLGGGGTVMAGQADG